MGDPLGLRKQRRQNAKLRLGQAEGPDLLFEASPPFPAEMQQQPAQQDAGDRHVGHALLQALQIGLHHFELGVDDYSFVI